MEGANTQIRVSDSPVASVKPQLSSFDKVAPCARTHAWKVTGLRGFQ